MLTPTLQISAAITFAALVVAMVTLWAPRMTPSPQAQGWWVLPFAAALMLAQGNGLVDTWGLGALFVLVTACRFGHQAADGSLRGFALAVMLAMSAGMLAHAVPGFTNPKVLDAVVASADAVPYTKYLNFDKGVMGLFLLGLFAPTRAVRRAAPGSLPLAWTRFAVVAAIVLALNVAFGYARWDPKLPAWWATWLWSMLFLTALPEEALFRHVIQAGLQDWLGQTPQARWTAIVGAATLFGLAHLGGGWIYVALATVAGIGYGLVYAVTGSVGAAILAHTALNLVHLLCFSYPALRARP